ncbi:hypothetical protein CRUP_031265, partial [Coryphaenoides rupestris]
HGIREVEALRQALLGPLGSSPARPGRSPPSVQQGLQAPTLDRGDTSQSLCWPNTLHMEQVGTWQMSMMFSTRRLRWSPCTPWRSSTTSNRQVGQRKDAAGEAGRLCVTAAGAGATGALLLLLVDVDDVLHQEVALEPVHAVAVQHHLKTAGGAAEDAAGEARSLAQLRHRLCWQGSMTTGLVNISRQMGQLSCFSRLSMGLGGRTTDP